MKTILEVVRDLIKPYIDKNANNIAPVEDSPVENPYYAGDQLIYKGGLYNVTADISIGDTLEIGTNISVAPKINSSVKSKLSSYSSDSTVWDTAPTANSTKPVTSGGVKTELDKKLPTYANGSGSWDTSPTASSTKPVTSGGVKTELDKKLPTYANGNSSWDTTPTNNSTKPVTSGGIYNVIKDEFKEVSGSTTGTLDLGYLISLTLSPPSGYTFFAIKSWNTTDWTVPVDRVQLNSNGTIYVQAHKLLSGSASVTLNATAIFRKSR